SRFMHERRRLERLAGLLFGQLLRGQLAQLVVDQRQELLRGRRIAALDGRQDAGDIAHVGQCTPRQLTRLAWWASGAERTSSDESRQPEGNGHWRDATLSPRLFCGHCRSTIGIGTNEGRRCLARSGLLDLRSEAEFASALRPDTPTRLPRLPLTLWKLGRAHAAAVCSYLNSCHPRPVSGYM